MEDGFLRALADNPHDDALRLVYADYLDERGDSRGELLRLQIALASNPESDPQRAELQARLRHLRSEASPEWLALVESPPTSPEAPAPIPPPPTSSDDDYPGSLYDRMEDTACSRLPFEGGGCGCVALVCVLGLAVIAFPFVVAALILAAVGLFESPSL